MDRYKITFETWNKIADLYQEKFMDLDLYDDSYDLFCTQFENEKSTILEIGCGPGNITRYLLSKNPEFQILGIDIAPSMIDLARQNNPSVLFEVMDCRMMNQITERFDGMMVGFCLPYLSKEDVEKLIQDAAILLNEEGVIYLSTIEGDYETSGFETGSTGDKVYVYYHSESFLKAELTKNGFEIICIFKKKYPKGEEEQQIHLIVLARKLNY